MVLACIHTYIAIKNTVQRRWRMLQHIWIVDNVVSLIAQKMKIWKNEYSKPKKRTYEAEKTKKRTNEAEKTNIWSRKNEKTNIRSRKNEDTKPKKRKNEISAVGFHTSVSFENVENLAAIVWIICSDAKMGGPLYAGFTWCGSDWRNTYGQASANRSQQFLNMLKMWQIFTTFWVLFEITWVLFEITWVLFEVIWVLFEIAWVLFEITCGLIAITHEIPNTTLGISNNTQAMCWLAT